MPNGKIQPEFTDTLALVGNWMQKNGETIYGTRGNLIPAQDWGVVTNKGKNIYAHIINTPHNDFIFLPGLKEKIIKANNFDDGATLKFKQVPEGVFVYLNSVKLNSVDNILKLTTN